MAGKSLFLPGKSQPRVKRNRLDLDTSAIETWLVIDVVGLYPDPPERAAVPC